MTLFGTFLAPPCDIFFFKSLQGWQVRLITRPRLAIGSSKKAEFLNEKKVFVTNCFKKGQMSIQNHWFLGINYSKISNALKKEVYLALWQNFSHPKALLTEQLKRLKSRLKSKKSFCDISTTLSERHVFEWPLITDFILVKINN